MTISILSKLLKKSKIEINKMELSSYVNIHDFEMIKKRLREDKKKTKTTIKNKMARENSVKKAGHCKEERM